MFNCKSFRTGKVTEMSGPEGTICTLMIISKTAQFAVQICPQFSNLSLTRQIFVSLATSLSLMILSAYRLPLLEQKSLLISYFPKFKTLEA